MQLIMPLRTNNHISPLIYISLTFVIRSVHLCETCCRVEHESTFGSHKYNPSRRSSNNGHASDAAKAYVVRPHKVTPYYSL